MSSVLACCRRFGHQEPTLWVQALWSCIRESKGASMDLLPEVLFCFLLFHRVSKLLFVGFKCNCKGTAAYTSVSN